MPRRSVKRMGPVRGILVAVLTSILGVSTHSCTSSNAPCKLPPPKGSQAPSGLTEVLYCPKPSVSDAKVTAQFLIDDSGSMQGFRAHMPALSVWAEQAASQFRHVGIAPTIGRACYFSAQRPLEECRGGRWDPGAFRGVGDTVLHTAVRSASDYDLTFIITDGASAAGDASGDCAGGVDPACVARSFAATLMPRPGEPPAVKRGIWFIPLIAPFRGPLFTEQYGVPGSVNPSAIAGRIASEMGTVARVSSPRQDAKGLLLYNYEGPRALLVLVLARDVELGRTFLAALETRREFSQIGKLRLPAEYRGGVAALPAVEVYPGLAPRLEWDRVRPDDAAAQCGSVTATAAGKSSVRLDCSPSPSKANLYFSASAPPVTSDCIVLQSLPVPRPELQDTYGKKIVGPYAWLGSQTDPRRPLTLGVQVQCREEWNIPCSSSPARATWIVNHDYRASASALSPASKEATSPVRLVQSLSAPAVLDAPHRIFQLSETLEKFYLNAAGMGPHSSRVTSIQFCKEGKH